MNRIWHSAWLTVGLFLAAALLLWLRPEADPGHGLDASYYANPQWQEPVALRRLGALADISMDGNLATSNQANFSIQWDGSLQIEQAGRYRFLLDSDDGSSLWLDARKIVNNSGTHVRRQRQGEINLSAGLHSLRVRYSQGVGDSFFRVRWQTPGQNAWQAIPLRLLRPESEPDLDPSRAQAAKQHRLILHLAALLLALLALAHGAWRLRPRMASLGWRSLLTSGLAQDLICLLICFGFYAQAVAVRLPHEPYLKGDSPYYANTAISVLQDGDLDQRNQSDASIFENPSPSTNIGMYRSNIARGVRGEWYPKHTILLPLLSVPFYAIWGGLGFLLCNLLLSLALVVVVRRLAAMFASQGAAAVAAVLIGITPLFHHYAYSFSADILSAVLVGTGLIGLFSGRSLGAGLLLGLSVWVKVPNGLLLPLALLVLIMEKDRRSQLRYLIGASISLGAFAALNWYQFGAPWITSYQRVWTIQAGVAQVGDHLSSFDFPFFQGLHLQLIDPVHGLFATAGVSLIAVLGYGRLYKTNRAAFWLVFLFSSLTFLFYCKYNYLTGSHYGNRFLMPVVALSAVPLACLIDWITGHRVTDTVAMRTIA